MNVTTDTEDIIPLQYQHRRIRDAVSASVAFDSRLQPRIAGFRSGSPDPSRQIVLRDLEFDIHIKITRNATGRQIHGQLLPRTTDKSFSAPAQCHVLHNGLRLESTMTDETGEFHFEGLPEGGLYLQIDLPDLTIVGSLNPDDVT